MESFWICYYSLGLDGFIEYFVLISIRNNDQESIIVGIDNWLHSDWQFKDPNKRKLDVSLYNIREKSSSRHDEA